MSYTENKNRTDGFLTMQIPFMGFYESIHDSNMDYALESWAEYEATESDNAAEYEALEINAGDLQELRFNATDFSAARYDLLPYIVRGIRERLEDETGEDIPLKLESMTSPKYYNFETDRLFVTIPASFARKMRKEVSDLSLRMTIKERHTSRSGFYSFYRSNFESWLKPVKTWDHNDLMTLFIAWLLDKGVDESEYNNFEMQLETYEPICQALDSATDWKEYESKLDELKTKKREELGIAAADIPYRCTKTIDLFSGNGV